MLNLGLGLYDVTIIGTFLLTALLWRKEIWRKHPAFCAYLAMCLLRCAILHPAFRGSDRQHYEDLFWYLQVLGFPFLGAAVGELFKQKVIGAITGSFVSLIAGFFMLSARALLAMGDRPAALSQALLSVDVLRYSGLILAMFALCAVRGISGIASGLVITTTFGALGLLASPPWHYASTAAWIVALFLWIDWIRTYRATDKSQHNPLRSSALDLPPRTHLQPRHSH